MHGLKKLVRNFIRVGLNRRNFDRRTLLGVASVFPSGQQRRSRFPVLDVFWTSFGREFSADILSALPEHVSSEGRR